MNAVCRCFTILVCCLSAFAAKNVETANANAEDYFRAIRANDLPSLQRLCKLGGTAVADRLAWTPLHYAALYGSTDAVRIVLAAGADPNARNRAQATPLIFAAYSLAKTQMLVDKGGDVNARASDGTTPLWVAAGAAGNEKTIRFLLDHGANTKEIRPNGSDYLIRAAGASDQGIVRLLLDRELDPHRANRAGVTALQNAITCDGGAKARMLIASGANVNAFTTDAGKVKNGPIDAFGLTPLMDAAACAETATVTALIQAGANLNALDHRHMTALMMAVAVDRADPNIVRTLIEAGADLNIEDRNSETALDWARKYRNPEVVALLEKAGARGRGVPPVPVRPPDYQPDAREAIARASALLAKSNEVFFREGGGCVGCHHQPFAGRAFGALSDAGVPAEPRLKRILADGMIAQRPKVVDRLAYLTMGGGGSDTFLYELAGCADMREPATVQTDVMVHFIAQTQDPTGGWIGPGNRAPLQESSITRTMLAIYALKRYGWPARQAEFDERILRARTWLTTARAATTVDEADRLMGLWLAGAAPRDLRRVSEVVLSRQRSDGGWAQTPYLESDAFGTAAALYSLRKTGYLKASDAAYRRGTQYLLNTQFPDGSWYVRSRVVKLQPYFQSDFPFDHDQWISNTATAYAVMALAPLAGGK